MQRPAWCETTSLGAALVAGLAVGFYSREQVAGFHERTRTFRPQVRARGVDGYMCVWGGHAHSGHRCGLGGARGAGETKGIRHTGVGQVGRWLCVWGVCGVGGGGYTGSCE